MLYSKKGDFMIEKLANTITIYFENTNELGYEDIEKINYILRVILDECFKLIGLFILFLLIGKINLFVYSLCILSTIRVFSGGTHFNSSLGCFLFTAVFFSISTILFPFLNLTMIHYIIFSIISIVLITIKSPIPSPMRPIKSKKRRCYLKILSIFSSLLWLYILFFIIKDENLVKCGIGTILLQGLQLIKSGGILHEEET